MILKDYLPLFFRQIREFDKLSDAEQPEFDTLEVNLKAAENNQFIRTLDANGCARWESMLGITPLDTATIEDRRFAILTMYQEELPYTWRSLINRLNVMLGSSNYLMTENREAWTLTVKVLLTRKHQINEVIKMLEEIVPCNIIISVILMYNTNAILANYTHGQLADYTHYELREEVLQ